MNDTNAFTVGNSFCLLSFIQCLTYVILSDHDEFQCIRCVMTIQKPDKYADEPLAPKDGKQPAGVYPLPRTIAAVCHLKKIRQVSPHKLPLK